MSTVDDRIVSVHFDNAAFEAKVASTMATLDKLEKSLSMTGASKGLENVSTAANNVDLSKMAAGVDNISSKFSVMGAIGFSAIQKITQGVMGFATSMIAKGKNDILGPIISGGTQRAKNIEQAQFMFEGLGINVEQGMASAKAAVLGTAYGLDEAAKAAAQFGASGIKVGPQMTGALRGVAGSAAMTGSSFREMADIFAGSAASGKVNMMDLQQFSTRGLNAAAAIAPIMGKTEKEVRAMASAGKLDFATFANAMDKAFGKHATEANKTYEGSLSNMHAAMSRLGAELMGPKLIQQRDLFNALTPAIDAVHKALTPLINTFLGIRQMGVSSLIKTIKGMDLSKLKIAMPNFQAGFLNAFDALGRAIGAIKAAFKDIFPQSAGSQLVAFSEGFKNFTNHLKMGADTLDKVKSIFKGFFSIIAIGIEIVKGIIFVFEDIFIALKPAGEGFLGASANLGEFLSKLKLVLVDGGGIHNFFVKLGEVITTTISFIQKIKDKIVDFFNTDTGVGGKGISSGFDRIEQRVKTVSGLMDKIKTAFSKVGDFLAPVWDYIKTWFSQLGSKIAEAFKPGDFNSALDIVNIGLLGGITLMLKKFFAGGVNVGFNGGFITKINNALGGVTKSLAAMQTNLKASALLKIAAAMALLTASIVVLSLIDSAKLTKALTAIAVGFGELIGTMTLMDKLVGSAGSAMKLGILGGALIALSVAIGILAAAVKIFSSMDPSELVKGLAGVAVGLGLLVAATNFTPAYTGGLVQAGASMILLSTGLLILAKAVKSFATMSWADLAKGLAGVAGGLLVMSVAMNAMPPSSILSGAGFIEVAAGLLILARAVKSFSTMSWSEMGKGMVGIGAGLVIIAGAMHLMPLSTPVTAAGILILSVALDILARAVKNMGGNDLGTLAKGLGAFAVMLFLIVGAVNAMDGAVTGAAALVIVSGALYILSKVLKVLGQLSVKEIITSLGAIAGVFLVLGLAGLALSPVIPEIMALSVALGILGGAFALFGIGASLIAKSFEIMGKSGAAGAKGMVDAIKTLITVVPQVDAAIAQSIIDLVSRLLKAAPLLIRLLGAVIDQLAETVIKEAPKIAEAFGTIIVATLKLIRDSVPDFVATGFAVLLGFLKGIRDNIVEIVTVVVEIITKFLDTLAQQVPQIIDSVYNLLTAVIKGVVLKIVDLGKEFIPAGLSMLGGLLLGILQKVPEFLLWWVTLPFKIIGWLGDLASWLIPKGLDLLGGFLSGIGSAAVAVMTWFIGLPMRIVGWIGNLIGTILSPKGKEAIAGFYAGLGNAIIGVMTWFIELPGRIIGWIGNIASKLIPKGVELLGGFLTGMHNGFSDVAAWVVGIPSAILNWIPDFGKTLLDAGKAILQGLLDGMLWVWNKVTGFVSGIGSWISDHKGPPSKDAKLLVNAGRLIMGGLHSGLKAGWNDISNWLDKLNPSDSFEEITVSKLQNVLSLIPDKLSDMENFNPVITPVLDLSKVQSASNTIAGYLKVSAITPDVSIAQARTISTTSELDKTAAPVVAPTLPTTVTFEQNIYSPSALSTNDIYKNTKSQIVLAKEKLGIS